MKSLSKTTLGITLASPFLVMKAAIRMADVRATANSARWLFVFYKMLFLRLAKNQVFNSVVVALSVNVVNNLTTFKKPANMFFHHGAMFVNSVVRVPIRVTVGVNADVSIYHSNAPILIPRTKMWIFSPKFVTTFSAPLRRALQGIPLLDNAFTISATCLSFKKFFHTFCRIYEAHESSQLYAGA